jgi:hypothetical protein
VFNPTCVAYGVGDHDSAQASDQSASAGTIRVRNGSSLSWPKCALKASFEGAARPFGRPRVDPPRAAALEFQCSEGLSSSARITRSVDASHRGAARSTRLQWPR